MCGLYGDAAPGVIGLYVEASGDGDEYPADPGDGDA